MATGEVVAVKIVRKERPRGRGEGGAWEVPGSVEREVVVMMVLGGLELEEEEGKGKGQEGKGMGEAKEKGKWGRGKLVGLRDVFENGWEV